MKRKFSPAKTGGQFASACGGQCDRRSQKAG